MESKGGSAFAFVAGHTHMQHSLLLPSFSTSSRQSRSSSTNDQLALHSYPTHRTSTALMEERKEQHSTACPGIWQMLEAKRPEREGTRTLRKWRSVVIRRWNDDCLRKMDSVLSYSSMTTFVHTRAMFPFRSNFCIECHHQTTSSCSASSNLY